MQIGLISGDDFSNFQYGIQESLKTVGLEVKSYKLSKHVFNYDKQVEVVGFNEAYENLKECDVIISFHSYKFKIPNKITIPFHTGTFYRQNYKEFNEYFADSPFALIALPEFQKLTDNFKYVVGAVDTESLQPVYKQDKNRTIFGHYPSNSGVKGSFDIHNTLIGLGLDYRHSYDRLPYNEHIERLKGIDVCIELMNKEQGGKPYGSFGMTALEAAALGKIVITQSLNDEGLYQDNYDIPLLNFIKDSEDLKKICLNLDNYNDSHIRGQQELTRKWVENNHSFKATGERLKRILDEL